VGALLHQVVEGHRELGTFGSTVRSPSLVHATELVNDRAADAQRGIRLERNAAARIEAIDSADEADHRCGRGIVTVRE
jgi:hypothetical protein